jgi:hypothetical protein
MGQAYHRKRIAVGRGTKTRGVGIRYTLVMPPAPRELTAEDIAAREVDRQKQVALEEGRRLREWNITVLVNVGQQMLRLWQKAINVNEKRLAEFAGWWTIENVCSFPPDDADVAASYLLAIDEYTKKAGNPPHSVEERDAVFDYCFHNQRKVPLVKVAEQAIELVRTAAEKCCDREGIDVELFLQMLARRGVKAKSNRSNLDSALLFLDAKMTLMFDVLHDGDGRDDFDTEMAEPETDMVPLCWVKI